MAQGGYSRNIGARPKFSWGGQSLRPRSQDEQSRTDGNEQYLPSRHRRRLTDTHLAIRDDKMTSNREGSYSVASKDKRYMNPVASYRRKEDRLERGAHAIEKSCDLRHRGQEREARSGRYGTSSDRRRQQRRLDIYTLKTLSSADPSEIVSQLGAEGSGCEEFLNSRTMNDEMKRILLKTLARGCQCTSSRMLMSKLLVLIWKSTYFTTHLSQLICSLLTKTAHQEDKEIIADDILTIMHALLQQIPSSCPEVGVLIPLLESMLRSKDQPSADSYKDVRERLQGMKDLYQTLVVDENDRVRHAVLKSHYKPAPDDFRQIPLLPTAKELNEDIEPFLRENLVSGKYIDKDHYLDVQYRLLREDFVAPLRQGISDYLDRKRNPEKYKGQKRIDDLRLYTKVNISDPSVGRNGIIHNVKFDIKPLSNVTWETTKRLLPGSLVCLTKDDFNVVLFAVVEQRETKELQAGRIQVKFDRLCDIIEVKPDEEFVMAETTAYFEQYRHVLLGLQRLGKLDLYGKSLPMPMEQYIIEVSRKIAHPSYLIKDRNEDDIVVDTTPHYDLHHLRPKHIRSEKKYMHERMHMNIRAEKKHSGLVDSSDSDSVSERAKSPTDSIRAVKNYTGSSDSIDSDSDTDSDSESAHSSHSDTDSVSEREQTMNNTNKENTRRVQVLETGLWPSAESLQFNESQIAAFQSALTREFALIQGPPGTGKTYVGLKIVETLLKNKVIWSESKMISNSRTTQVNTPILVVCYTNHALDQFLEGIYGFDHGVIRVGGGSKSEILTECNLTKIRSKKRLTSSRHRRRVYEDYERLKRILENAEDRLKLTQKSIINEFALLPYMNENHFVSLRSTIPFQEQENIVVILRWLGLTGDQWTNKKQKQIVQQIHEQIEDGNIDVLGEAELITKLRLMEEEDPITKANRKKRWTALLEEFAFVIDHPPEDPNLTESYVKWIGDVIEYELGDRRESKCSDQQAEYVQDVWTLPQHLRFDLYRYWLARYVHAQKQMILNSQEIYEKLSEQQREFDVEEDEDIVQHASVIGMTTTGAAKNQILLQRVKPKIIIVEEAAEVLESHIITTLTNDCQHLIMIGDHQQLRPNPTVYRLAKKFKLDVSLFERMMKNRLPCEQLHQQHRMRPEISILMKRHFYEDLIDHSSVQKYRDVKGVTCNMYFVQHEELEDGEEDSRSRSNEHEADFLVGLCRYLLQQGYSRSQITILTTYTGQMFNLRKQMDKDKDTFDGVRVSVVDNFQGEENDIILLSLVRSNTEGSVGFLKIDNRICVALSRAKIGLYCIGNLQLLASKSDKWKDILATLSEKKATGSSLGLICHNHEHITHVSRGHDFKKALDGGCSKRCEYRLPCGHVCDKWCHPLDPDHKETVCDKPCTKECKRVHPCDLKCFESCKCQIKVDITMEGCGHQQTVRCHEVESWKCKEPCERKIECGHLCTRTCGEECLPQYDCENPCEKKCVRDHLCTLKCGRICTCTTIATKSMPSCGHEQQLPCNEYDTWSCKAPCEKELKCGHTCTRSCGQTCLPERKCENPCSKTCPRDHPCTLQCNHINNRLDVIIKKYLNKHDQEKLLSRIYSKTKSSCCKCGKVLSKTMQECGHQQDVPCKEYERWTCKEPCEKMLECGHPCREKCGEYCDDELCEEPCEKMLECGHPCRRECGEDCSSKLCKEPCAKDLRCGHSCSKQCYMKCEALSMITHQERECTHKVQIKLPGCSHEVEVLCKNNPEINDKYKMLKNEVSSGVRLLLMARRNRITDTKEPTYPKCRAQCSTILECGHQCSNRCETCTHTETEHSEAITPCKEKCNRALACGHTCQELCSDSCSLKCVLYIEKELPKCGHKKQMKCCDDPKNAFCDKKCSRKLPCDHSCKNRCGDPCQKECKQMVTKVLPKCGHELIVECKRNLTDARCKTKCSQKLPCGHTCKNKCYEKCTSKCNVSVEKELECGHKKRIECWKKENVKCQEKCTKKLPCGHMYRGLCSKLHDTKCSLEKKVTNADCDHTMFIKCHQNITDVTCTGPCKKKLPCGHKCKNPCGEPCQTKCQAKRTEFMKDCRHRQQVLCQMDVKDHICQQPCRNVLKCRHQCVKRCGEQCSCGKTSKVRMTRCGHMQELGCGVQVSKHVCQEKCRHSLRCGHKCTKLCGEPCVTQCNHTREVLLRNCKHKQMIPCHMHPKDFKCTAKCKRKLPCGHQCREVCSQPCTKRCQEVIKRNHKKDVKCSDNTDDIESGIKCSKKLACGHKCVALRGESCKCNGKCPKRLPCYHWCKEKCGDPCTKDCTVKVKKKIKECGHELPNEVPCYVVPKRADCKGTCKQKLLCGHTCNQRCNECTGHSANQTDRHCQQVCGTLLKCRHRCRALCHECLEGRLHKPCKNQCQTTLLCGCKCQRQCNLCMNNCGSCRRDHRNRDNSDTCCTKHDSMDTIDHLSLAFSKTPCTEKLKCGHGCIGLNGESCIKICGTCDSKKLRKFFPQSKLSKDSCFIKLTPCGHIAEISSMADEFGASKESHPIKPIRCPKCKQIVVNDRFKCIISVWKNDVDKIKSIVDGEKRSEPKLLNLNIPFTVYAENSSQYSANSDIWMTEIQKQASCFNNLQKDAKGSADAKEIASMKLKINETFESNIKVLSQQISKKRQLTAQMIYDIAHELRRICCWLDIYVVVDKTVSSYSCSKPITTTIDGIVSDMSTGGRFTDWKFKDLQRRLQKLQVEVFGNDRMQNPHSMSLPVENQCPAGFTMDTWFKCRNGHYFSKPRCSSRAGASKADHRCPLCSYSTEEPSTSNNKQDVPRE